MLLNDTKSGTTLNKWQFWFHIYENTSREIYPTLKDFIKVVFGDSVKTKPGTAKQVATGVAAKNPVYDIHGNVIGCVSYGIPLEIKDGEIKVILIKEKPFDCLYVIFPGEKILLENLLKDTSN